MIFIQIFLVRYCFHNVCIPCLLKHGQLGIISDIYSRIEILLVKSGVNINNQRTEKDNKKRKYRPVTRNANISFICMYYLNIIYRHMNIKGNLNNFTPHPDAQIFIGK